MDDWTGLGRGLALVACLVDSGADPHITASTFWVRLGAVSSPGGQGIGLHKRQLRAAWAYGAQPVVARARALAASSRPG